MELTVMLVVVVVVAATGAVVLVVVVGCSSWCMDLLCLSCGIFTEALRTSATTVWPSTALTGIPELFEVEK